MVGRTSELRALVARIEGRGVTRLALVGGGGSGKSLLACALGHRVRRHFPGGIHWLRVGSWDTSTLFEMLARRLGVGSAPGAADPLHDQERRVRALHRALEAAGRTLVVLDNHENDRALARFLDELRACPVTWVVTARRCLLSGVEVFPVIPPLVTSGRSAFSRVAALTTVLRWNPLALDIADGLITSKAITLRGLRRYLVEGGVERVRPMRNEDDVAEVRLLVDWAWPRLSGAARHMLAVLAHSEGDDVDLDSLVQLARAGDQGAAALRELKRFRLVQEPLAGRFTVHAVVRQAVAQHRAVARERYFQHYVGLLERHPERVALEQTHLYAAMDHAHAGADLSAVLRIERLLSQLDGAGGSDSR
jgi:hypothetical protein